MCIDHAVSKVIIMHTEIVISDFLYLLLELVLENIFNFM